MSSRILLMNVALGCCLNPPTIAWARIGTELELTIGGGRDNGLFPLAVELPAGTTTDDLFLETRPSAGLLLSLSHTHELRIGYLGSYRRFALPENGWAHAHLAHGSYSLAVGPLLRFEASLLGAAEQFTAVDSAYQVGGGTFGPTLALFGLRLSVRGEAQWIDSPALRGPLGGIWTSIGWQSSRWAVAATGRWRTDGLGWQQAAAGVNTDLVLGPLSGRAELQGGSSDETLWLSWTASVAAHLSPRWALVGDYRGSALFPPQSDLSAQAHVGTLGARFTWESVPAGVEQLLDRIEQRRSPPASRTGLTLWVRTPTEAASLALLADFNGWEAAPLSPESSGLWRLHLPLPPGRYAFQLLLDEQRCVPEGAPAYRDDGFGGRNAVLVVGDAAVLELRCAP